MIYAMPDGTYSISSHRVWLPAILESRAAAHYAFQFTDEVLDRLQKEANQRAGGTGGTVTMDDLKRAASRTDASPEG